MDCTHYKLIHDRNITFHLIFGKKITIEKLKLTDDRLLPS